MATWRYIKGIEADFTGAPNEALILVVDNIGRKYFGEMFPVPGAKHWSDLGRKGVWGSGVKNTAFTVIAQRERVTSVNDDRLAQDMGIDQLIAERGSRYGKFADGAEIMRDLKHVMHEVDGWNNLTASQKEALDMIQHKIGRILNGDPTYDDNWKDIAGYATLVAEELNGVKK